MHDDAPDAPEGTVSEKLPICPNCGGRVSRNSPHGPFPTFCSRKCKREKGNRDLARGSVIIGLAQAWRRNRGQGDLAKAAFWQMNSIIDQFNAEDREAGRPFADLHVAKQLATGYLYIDRQSNWGMRKRSRDLRSAIAFTDDELKMIAARFAGDNDPDGQSIASKAAELARLDQAGFELEEGS